MRALEKEQTTVRRIVTAIIAAALAASSLAAFGPASAGQISMRMGGVSLNMPVKSYKERRFSTVMAQRYDYSCGSAAVASLLSYHYNDKVSEIEVFKSMYANGDQAKIAREGFSLLDMKQYLERRGYKANGYRAPLDKLAKNKVPAVVLLKHDGYLHFVVVKGVIDKQILVGDPSLGIKAYPRSEFKDMWNGIVFVILSDRDVANQNFNRRGEWALWTPAPLGRAMSGPSLASFTLMRPQRNDF